MSNKLGKRRRLRTIMAYHEAGHAAAARVLGVDVAFVSMRRLDPDTVAAAPAHSALWRSRGADTETRSGAAEADAKVALAGPTAEQYAPIRHPKVELADDMKNALQGVGCAAALAAGMEIPEQGAAGFELTGAVKADALARLDRLKKSALGGSSVNTKNTIALESSSAGVYCPTVLAIRPGRVQR